MRKGLPYPPSGYEELDSNQLHPNHEHYHRITPSPGDCYGLYYFYLLLNTFLNLSNVYFNDQVLNIIYIYFF